MGGSDGFFTPSITFQKMFSWHAERIAPQLKLEINLHCASTILCMNLELLTDASYLWDTLLLFWVAIPQKTKVSAVFKIVKKLGGFVLLTVIMLKPFLKIMLLTKICIFLWAVLMRTAWLDLHLICKLISADCFELERNLIWKLPYSTPCGRRYFSTSSVKQCTVSIWLFLSYLNCFL